MKIHFVDGQPVLWAGSEASFTTAVKAQALALADQDKIEVREQTYDGADGLPPMIAKQNGVGILSISGSLVDGQAGYMRYYDVVGYDEIVAAAQRLYADPEVKKVLVRIDSPGGMVDGIMDAGEALSRLSASKPSMVYTGSMAASGGYWLAGSIKGPLVVGPTAQVGSIGVVKVHTEYSKMYEELGITQTVLRSGENKARLNSIEPLTPEVKAAEEAKMADVHNIFRAQVAAARPNLSTEDLLEVTKGDTFMGKRAKAAGLADKVGTFEQALKLLDSHNPSSNTSSNPKGAPMKLTEQQIALLQSGVPASQLGLSADDLAACQAEIDAIINANKVNADDKIDGDKKPEVKDGTGANPPPAADAQLAELTEAKAQVALLTKQLSEANEKLVGKTAEVQNLTAAQAPMQANLDALHKIAQSAVSRFQLGLGMANTADSLTVADVITTHTKLSESFNTQFKVGGVSKSPAPETQKAPVPFGFGMLTAQSATRK